MTIVDDGEKPKEDAAANPAQEPGGGVDKSEKKDDGILSQENISSDTTVPAKEVSSGGTLGIGGEKKDVVITVEDKAAFVDSVVNNTRFEKDYSLFGGKLKVRIRSVTSEECNALAAWSFKKAVKDPAWHLSGQGRKNILSAQVSMFNGTELPPLAQPLFETVGKDGKPEDPGWVASTAFWDGKSAATVDAIMKCLSDFDMRYTTLCSKAEDENFWLPDTH